MDIPSFVKNNESINEIFLKDFSSFLYSSGLEVIISGFDEDTKLLKKDINNLKKERFNPIISLSDFLFDDDLINLTTFLLKIPYYKKRYSLDRENVEPNVKIALMDVDSVKFMDSYNTKR